MSLKQQMAIDAKNIFVNTDEFAETIVYSPYGGTAKNVQAVISRERIDAGDSDRNRTVRRQAEIQIPNDSTSGVAAINKGQDAVQFPVYKGGSASTWKVIDVIEHDEGMWRLLVER